MESTAAAQPSARVLDLFAVPGAVEPLPGSRSFRAGDLVLSPDRDPAVLDWLAPQLARLSVRLAERPDRRPGDLRIAVPVPARDGHWTADGWGATAYEPDSVSCTDVDVLVATADLLHAEFAVAVPAVERPSALAGRTDRWARAERLAFDGTDAELTTAAEPAVRDLVADLAAARTAAELGADQLVHADVSGNVLLAHDASPVVIDVSPAWRPARWARAVVVVDAVTWMGADPDVLSGWRSNADRQAIVRALLFRVFSDADPRPEPYRQVLDAVG